MADELDGLDFESPYEHMQPAVVGPPARYVDLPVACGHTQHAMTFTVMEDGQIALVIIEAGAPSGYRPVGPVCTMIPMPPERWRAALASWTEYFGG